MSNEKYKIFKLESLPLDHREELDDFDFRQGHGLKIQFTNASHLVISRST